MEQWLKTMTGSMCVITILMHLLPQGKFTKYVRFYAGLLLFLIAVRPILNVFTGEGGFERLLQMEFLREESYDMETFAIGMEELKDDRIARAYQEELRRQIREMTASYGLEPVEILFEVDEADPYRVKKIEISVWELKDTRQSDALKEELFTLYMVDKKDIVITGRR
ncbi:MAG: stage III sporulation protein AF [Lachnospiraceae bacterium]|jgi:stage III sporulation protein AF|nr:stage III sporulation protein AF [Lachnospiraceae bacterium]RKJ51197.1 hypothetical protein D7Y05_04530 [bacterium 1XD42-54]